jgi:hypothetical protein
MDITTAGLAMTPLNRNANRECKLIYFAQNPSLSDVLTAIEMNAV